MNLLSHLSRIVGESRARDHLDAGRVLVDGEPVTDGGQVVTAGQRVTLRATEEEGAAAVERAASLPTPVRRRRASARGGLLGESA